MGAAQNRRQTAGAAPPNIPAIEPDTRGLTTLRAILEKHRADVSCAGCHAKMDPPGFALESYDAIGGFRARFRSLGNGDRITRPPACAGRSEFLLGLPVDASGELAAGRGFKDIREFKQLLFADESQIARNFASQIIVYATGAPVSFSDRAAVERILADTAATKHGIRTIEAPPRRWTRGGEPEKGKPPCPRKPNRSGRPTTLSLRNKPCSW